MYVCLKPLTGTWVLKKPHMERRFEKASQGEGILESFTGRGVLKKLHGEKDFDKPSQGDGFWKSFTGRDFFKSLTGSGFEKASRGVGFWKSLTGRAVWKQSQGKRFWDQPQDPPSQISKIWITHKILNVFCKDSDPVLWWTFFPGIHTRSAYIHTYIHTYTRTYIHIYMLGMHTCVECVNMLDRHDSLNVWMFETPNREMGFEKASHGETFWKGLTGRGDFRKLHRQRDFEEPSQGKRF